MKQETFKFVGKMGTHSSEQFETPHNSWPMNEGSFIKVKRHPFDGKWVKVKVWKVIMRLGSKFYFLEYV